MKRIASMFLVLTLCFSLFGCGGKDNGSKEENVQGKLENAKWEVKLDREVGTEIDDLSIKVNAHQTFDISRTIKDDNITTIDFSDGKKTDKYTISYNLEDKTNYMMHNKISGVTCVNYDLTNNKEDEKWGEEMSKCSVDERKDAKEIMSDRDKKLKKLDITLKDLEDWAKWYYKNN